MKELYAGVDIHKENYVGCIMDKDGKISSEADFKPTQKGAEGFFAGIPIKAVAIEACGMWRPAMRLFKEQGYKVKLTSPKKTKDIAGKKKTDKIDAKTLANLLRTGFLPEVYIPNDKMLELRDITRHKKELTVLKVEIQNRIKSYMLREGIKYPSKLWNKENLVWLSKLNNPNIQNLTRIRDQFEKEEKETLSRIKKISNNMRLTNILMTMPGIAEFSS